MKRNCVSWKVSQVNRMFENGTLTFDNIIQRNYVWNNTQQSMLIDSLIRDFPVSVIYTIKTNETVTVKNKKANIFDCLDGKQRCTTINRYLNNEFALTGLEPIVTANGEYDLNGKYFKDLDKKYQDKIMEYGMTIYFFSEITDEEITEMMSRLNGGKPLSGIENARIKAKNLTTIKNLAAYPVIVNNLSATAIRNYANEDIIIKTTLMMNDITNLNNANVRMAYETFDFEDDNKYTLMEAMDIMNAMITTIKNNNGKKATIKKITAKTNFITVLYTITQIKDNYTVDELADVIYRFYNDIPEAYTIANRSATMRATNVETRNEELAKFIEATMTTATAVTEEEKEVVMA